MHPPRGEICRPVKAVFDQPLRHIDWSKAAALADRVGRSPVCASGLGIAGPIALRRHLLYQYAFCTLKEYAMHT